MHESNILQNLFELNLR